MTDGVRRKALVAFDKTYVWKGLFAGLVIAAFYSVDSVIKYGWTLHTAIIDIGYAVFMVVVWTWSSWHDDNRHEAELQDTARRRAHTRAKTH